MEQKCSLLLKKQRKRLLIFHKLLEALHEMETQKFVNLLNDSSDFPSKFATKKWYIMDSESKGNYAKENPIQFITNSIESSLCD